ncbi:MAG: exodeoxyribonuclease VII small subunit [Burkholderiales bacterium]|nr:exodeoxyribonuclease VII small subunit [Burkholderiales bacterium]
MSRSSNKSAACAEASTDGGPGFEKALAELERIVARMESGDLTLEEALAAHRRGLELAKYCREKLQAAEQQVQVLEGEVLKPLAAVLEAGREDREDA